MLDRFRRMEPFELAAQPDFPARMRHCMIADGRPLSGPGSLFFQIDLIGTFVAREPHRENDGNMPSAERRGVVESAISVRRNFPEEIGIHDPALLLFGFASD